MLVQQMTEIKNSRENLIGFLHFSDISKINELLNENVDKLSFDQVCDLVIEKYQSKQIKNKFASEIFEILITENKALKTNKYRFDNGKLFVFSETNNAYLFDKRITKKEFNTQSLGTIYM